MDIKPEKVAIRDLIADYSNDQIMVSMAIMVS